MSSVRIQKGKPQKNPTIQDVARLAEVSTATVSRVLAEYEAVSDDTRQRVYDAIRTLNYQINRNARNLRKNTTSKIGVVISDIQNPFFGSVSRGIENIAIDAGYTIILGNSDEEPQREKKLITMLLEEGVAGIIFVPTGAGHDSYQDLCGSGIPCVAIDRRVAACDMDMVLVNNRAGASAAVARLVELGHRRIAFVGGLEHLSVMREREQGYLATLERSSITIPDSYVLRGNNRQDGGYAAMRSLLALDPMPTAVLIANNLMTLGGLKAIHESDVRIPQQISLIGFDDMDWAPSLQPPLSVVAQPAYEMGQTAAKLILERLQNPNAPAREIVLQTRLIMRASCARL